MPTKPTVILLCGGISPEHEISLRSAKNIYQAIDKNKWQVEVIGIARDGTWRHLPEAEFMGLKKVDGPAGRQLAIAPGAERKIIFKAGGFHFPVVDVAFPIVHGPFGEDGTLQGLLQVLGLPFVGSDTLGSAVGMDKDFTKRILRDAGIPNAPWHTLFGHETPEYQAIVDELGFPLFVKPANMGSSVGVGKADDMGQLKKAVKNAFRFDKKVLVEKAIAGREFEIAVLGTLGNLRVSGAGEIVVTEGFYDYESKYVSADAAKIIIPAEGLSEKDLAKIQDTARRAFHALGLEGLARMDVFLTPSGEVYVNEPNTLPGFTNISMYPKLWEAAGLPYAQLIDRLLELAMERHEREGKLLRRRG